MTKKFLASFGALALVAGSVGGAAAQSTERASQTVSNETSSLGGDGDGVFIVIAGVLAAIAIIVIVASDDDDGQPVSR